MKWAAAHRYLWALGGREMSRRTRGQKQRLGQRRATHYSRSRSFRTARFVPEFVMRNGVARLNAAARGQEHAPELGGIANQQPIELVLVRDGNERRHGLPVPCDQHGPALACFYVRAELCFDVGDGCNLHSLISSPPMNRRLPRFTPMARMKTCLCSGSIP